MNDLVKITHNNIGVGGEEELDGFWHLLSPISAERSTLCGGVIVEEYDGVYGNFKTVKRGGITCPKCIDIIKSMKKVKL